MARNGDFPDFMEPPPPRENDRGGEDVPEKSNREYFWEKQLMREEFDRRLRELQSPWLAVGKDSKDESGGYRDVHIDNLCRKCMQLHDIAADNLVMEISELVEVNTYCEKILCGLEDLKKKEGGNTGPHNFDWLINQSSKLMVNELTRPDVPGRIT